MGTKWDHWIVRLRPFQEGIQPLGHSTDGWIHHDHHDWNFSTQRKPILQSLLKCNKINRCDHIIEKTSSNPYHIWEEIEHLTEDCRNHLLNLCSRLFLFEHPIRLDCIIILFF